MENHDRGDEYARKVRIDGNPQYEVGIRDTGGQGYLVDYVDYGPNDSRSDIKDRVEETKEDLYSRRDRMDSDNWDNQLPDEFD